MICPHCGIAFHDTWLEVPVEGTKWWFGWTNCPACAKDVVRLHRAGKRYLPGQPTNQGHPALARFTAWPQGSSRPVPSEVAEPFATDFREASAVLQLSPKASAAISRRLLQHLLREKAGVKRADLSVEIAEVLASRVLPTWLADDLDAVRNVGNFASHPIKSTSTGEVVSVEDGEAEWLLDVIEALFDFYFVGPASAQKKRDALNVKLQDAGKPILKSS